MARTEVGSAYVSIYPDTSNFSSQLSDELGANSIAKVMSGAGEQASKGFERGFSPVTVAIGNLMAEAATAAVTMFSQNLERGIARLDTIKNFPKLMQTFGYSAEEASASILSIQEHLDGLPGSTDEVLRLVQAISDSTGSLELATSTGLAFNDMLTASGADANTAMYATRMFDQMLGGAAYSAQRWQGIVSKMPLQMGMVAEYMLGAGATTSQLGDALKDGEISMQELAQAMTDLSPEFTKQAKAMSYGVGTAMTNVQNRMGMGVAAILDAVGQTRIANTINDFSYGVRDAMVWIADGVEWLRRKILVSGIGVLLEELGEKIGEAFESIDWQPVKDAASAVIDFIHDALQWILDNGDLVKAILVGIGTALMLAGVFDAVTKVMDSLFGASGLITMIMANPMVALIVAIGAVVAALVYFFTETDKGREIWANFTAALAEKWAAFKDKVKSIGKAITDAFEAIKNKIKQVWKNIKSAIEPVAQAIGKAVKTAWENIKTTTSNVFNKVKDIITPIWNSIKTIIGGVVQFITSLVKGDFEGMKSAVGTIFGGIRDLASSIWNGIKTVIANVVEGIKTVASNAWNAIKTTATTVWNAIKDAISKPIDAAKTAITNTLNAIKTFLSDIFGTIKSTATTAWNNIKTAITNPIETAKGVISGVMGGIQGIINGLTGKTVDVGVKDSRSTVSNVISGIQRSINGLTGKTVGINLHAYQSGIRTLDVQTYSTNTGNVYRYKMVPTYMAAGGIATSAIFGVFGEAGDEALVPLSNRSKVRPFARAVAAEMNGGGGVTVTGNTFYVRNDNDITRIAQEISTYSSRQMAGRL